MKIREIVDKYLEYKTSTDDIKMKRLYLEKLCMLYPNMSIKSATYNYADNLELLDKIIFELTNLEKVDNLKNELNEYQYERLMLEESLLVASYNLAVMRENKKLLEEMTLKLHTETLEKERTFDYRKYFNEHVKLDE